MTHQIKKRWDQFVQDGPCLNGEEVWSEIEKHYTEPHRKYHTLDHIAACLNLLDANYTYTTVLELSIWFHDIVYDTKATDNEEKSVDVMKKCAALLGYASELYKTIKVIETTEEFILATKSHKPAKDSYGLGLFLDIDMSILGTDEATYDIYEKQIREEYSWVPQDKFVEGRTKILTGFLDAEWIYHTGIFRKTYEGPARNNIKRAITMLKDTL